MKRERWIKLAEEGRNNKKLGEIKSQKFLGFRKLSNINP